MAVRPILVLLLILSTVQSSEEMCPTATLPYYSFPNIDLNNDSIQNALKQINDAIHNSITAVNVNAMSAGISYNGNTIWTFNYGSLNYDDPNSPMPTADTPYIIASQTKIFTALLALWAQNEGYIHMRDIVQQKFDKFKMNHSEYDDQITFYHLAASLSGLPREIPCEGLKHCEDELAWNNITSLVESLWEPDLIPSYSNLGYSILGHSIASILGCTYQDCIKDILIDDLFGLENTGFILDKRTASNMPFSRNPVTGKPWDKYIDLLFSAPSGQMYSTVNDMLKVTVDGYSARKETKTLWSEALRMQYASSDGLSGFALPFEVDYISGMWVPHKGGLLSGYHSNTAIVKDLRLGFTILTASNGYPTKQKTNQVMEILINAFKNEIKHTQELQHRFPSGLEHLQGNYSYRVEGYGTLSLSISVNYNRRNIAIVSGLSSELVLVYKRKDVDGNLYFVFGITDMLPCAYSEGFGLQGQQLVYNARKEVVYMPSYFGYSIKLHKLGV
eukprot:TRINITY_DN10539_c0_g1_i1.p1 TRINITY_DN10539_c0_g1~~TRINITY_DN10539_c0_g1_i1.p1  ORF type:complete len:503 (+),score=78.94 TRINITY_DN10539_c0_g1_i1:259-1767(+)